MSLKVAPRQSKSATDVKKEMHIVRPSCTIHLHLNLFRKYNTATWMHDMYKSSPSLRLNQLVIPGSHDSATDEMTKHSPYARFNKLDRKSVV